ncbi:CPBP family intramembrane glutamic endopeptidase [Silvibacterium acidisoli]|uniref:CPBP family intramembrane glutamic endopeptidase n=1 Tax=Acidobacteriaceae bacterium ZG23-2 TaxID=2883246 RepID=UPI00406D076B
MSFEPMQEPIPGPIEGSAFPPQPAHNNDADAAFFAYEPQELHLPRLIPNIGHAALFLVLAIVLIAVGQVLGIYLIATFHLYGHHGFKSLFRMSVSDARLAIPVQALSYLMVALACIPIFTVIWDRPFAEGVQWNLAAAFRHWKRFAVIGVACGFGITLLGNFLPMPKDPPIMQDMMKSPVGAWLMLLFGVTAAPIMEELAFRGFLLPSLINIFNWLARKGSITEEAARYAGIPFSVALTSLGFAFMHSPQVSHAWGPLLLIGMVSVVLCVVRLVTRSVAAGAMVHAAYNLTLFAGVLAETGGFRHLDKLN